MYVWIDCKAKDERLYRDFGLFMTVFTITFIGFSIWFYNHPVCGG